jgi:CRP-like cAMP-binding protein
MESLRQAIEKIAPLPDDCKDVFLRTWHYQEVPKDYPLLRENTIGDQLFFIEKGIARIFYHKNDKEITEWIAMDGQFFLSITSFFQRTPSHLGIHTLEPSSVYSIRQADFMQLADRYHAIEKVLRKMVTASLILSQKRMDAIQFETAQFRYERLLQESPGIIQRVPLSYIASFLGVTLETLSRIRGKH